MDGGRRLRVPRPPKAVASLLRMAAALLLLASGCRSAEAMRAPGGSLLDRFTKMMDVESIVKEAERLTFPIDNYWRNFQDKIPESVPFPCEQGKGPLRWRSEKRPSSVHRLRPGDVDVVGAIGDSITVATAAREFLISLTQDRGVSFTGGGLGTWRTITTMPNILKVFNPKLVGYAVGRGDFLSYNAQLNVAITSSIDDDAFNQVKLFVRKMKQDPRIDFKNDWKVLSIFIGHNDICSMHCLDSVKHSAKAHQEQLQKALNYLYRDVPRIFVNVVSLIDPTLTARVSMGPLCSMLRRIACSCLYRGNDYAQSLVNMSKLVSEYHEAEKELVNSRIYSGRDDFTVELQPFLRSTLGPTTIGEPEKVNVIEYGNKEKPWTPECFHFNQRGLASASILLWNNMLEPVGKKTIKMEKMTHKDMKCPTINAPYLFTKKNSDTYFKTGRQ
ncbi:phospholipase B1, membrane-associated-like [Ischnura elegans]|uniref:phospholipase B1, membrane-associated-like n=1 Tax=Ischnura elegans TaxID=197161 RepID=UPI001ED899A7|nr:phospholipase B1, membrane-associated-like [Ischnura elegans]